MSSQQVSQAGDLFFSPTRGTKTPEWGAVPAPKFFPKYYDNVRSAEFKNSSRCLVCGVRDGEPGGFVRTILSRRNPSSWEVLVEDLKAAVEAGCQVCAMIQQGFSKIEQDWQRFGWENIRVTPTRYPLLRVGENGCSPDLYVNSEATLKVLKAAKHSRWWQCVRVGPDFSSDTYDVISQWLLECDKHHKLCTDGPKPLPTRVIDVGLREGSDYCRLMETHGKSGRYIALSHCWGPDPSKIPITTASNYTDRLRGIAVEALSRTFRDAIHTTRFLGVQYLWIDSLCIIQGDRKDWGHESAKMCQVYGDSYLTLAATASMDGSGGLHASRTRYNSTSHTLPVRVKGMSFEISCRKPLKHNSLESGDSLIDPLSTRAWAYQERLLSRRIVHFAAEELLWECKTHQRCECQAWSTDIKKDLPMSFYSAAKKAFQEAKQVETSSSKGTVTINRWNIVVEAYTKRHLTVINDRMPAFSGIASATISDPKNYLAGLRIHRLIYDLSWYALKPGFRASKYRAPSWSWASIEAPIHFETPDTPPKAPFLTLLASSCTLATDDPFGSLSSGYITVKALCGEGRADGQGLEYMDKRAIFYPDFDWDKAPMDLDDELYRDDMFYSYPGYTDDPPQIARLNGSRDYSGVDVVSEGVRLPPELRRSGGGDFPDVDPEEGVRHSDRGRGERIVNARDNDYSHAPIRHGSPPRLWDNTFSTIFEESRSPPHMQEYPVPRRTRPPIEHPLSIQDSSYPPGLDESLYAASSHHGRAVGKSIPKNNSWPDFSQNSYSSDYVPPVNQFRRDSDSNPSLNDDTRPLTAQSGNYPDLKTEGRSFALRIMFVLIWQELADDSFVQSQQRVMVVRKVCGNIYKRVGFCMMSNVEGLEERIVIII